MEKKYNEELKDILNNLSEEDRRKIINFIKEEKCQPNYFSIIPAEVRYSNKINPQAKIFYSEISALANKEGYCFATNKYFTSLYNTSRQTIDNWLSSLKENDFIFIEYIKSEKGEILERRIYPLVGKNIKDKISIDNKNIAQKDLQGGAQKDLQENTKKDKHYNKINNNNKYIYIEEQKNLKNLKFEFAGGYNEPLKKWCDYKEKIGQPLSQESLNELYEYINEVLLKDCKEEDRPKELEKAVNYSIANNYKTIFPEKKIIKQEIKVSTNSPTSTNNGFIETNKEVLTQQIKQEIKEKEGNVDSTLKVYSIYCKEKKVILSTWHKENLYFLRRYDFSKVKCLKGFRVEVYFADYYDEKIRWDV